MGVISLSFVIIIEKRIRKPAWSTINDITCCSRFYEPYVQRRRDAVLMLSPTREMRAKYTLPLFIVVTYIFTTVVPLPIAAFFYDDCSNAMDSFLLTLIGVCNMNFIVVPILYVFIHQKRLLWLMRIIFRYN